MQQMAEETSSESPSTRLNPSVTRAAGVPCDNRLYPPIQALGRTFFHGNPRPPTTGLSKKKDFVVSKPLMVCTGTPNSEVKRHTGFPSEAMLLAYVFIVCNRDSEIIQERRSSLTCCEEWYSYFQFEWGRILTRWIDLEKEYGPCSKDEGSSAMLRIKQT